MEALIAANPDLFSGLTVDDADEIVHQIQLELTHINEGMSPLVRRRATVSISPISLRAISIWQA